MKANIKSIDEEIGKLTEELVGAAGTDEYGKIVHRIDNLTTIRSKLVEGSGDKAVKELLLSGTVTLASILLVLKYEKTDIITSKAFNMATKMFRG